MKATLIERAPKTVNNILTTLSMVLRTAVEWGVIERVPCSIKLLRAPNGEASLYDEFVQQPPSQALQQRCITCNQGLFLCARPVLELPLAC